MVTDLRQNGNTKNLQERLPEKDTYEIVATINEKIRDGKLRTFVPLLPLILSLNGKPYTLSDHFPFEPLFQFQLARRLVLKTGRQVSKSTSLAARGVLMSATIPHFSTLYVTPLYEQVRRFSTRYVRPFIHQSPFKFLLLGQDSEDSVLQKSFANQSRMFFSFCGLSVDRIRGISANQCCFDEVQDIDQQHIPIVLETMGGQKTRLEVYAGTSKTLDNTLEGLWARSSQAEWCIPCRNCRHLNVPKMGHDLEKMIGPYREDICEERPGTICAKCAKPILPRDGKWVHEFPERKDRFSGYHVPQIIMPIHYASPERWGELLAKQSGQFGYNTARFYNEVLGEAYDVGTKLVNKTDLQRAACLPWDCRPDLAEEIARQVENKYDLVVMGVDWGGGGEDEISYTTCAVVGFMATGGMHVIYGERLLTPHDHVSEASRLMHIFRLFNCRLLAHDYNGAGSIRETIMVQAGLPLDVIVPMVYYRSAAADIMVFRSPQDHHPRYYWHLDKARSLVLVCQTIKLGLLKFFRYDFDTGDQTGLLHDFLALVEHKIPTGRGPDIYTVRRHANLSDDFAHSVNFACCAIWNWTQSWPNLAALANIQMSPADHLAADGIYPFG